MRLLLIDAHLGSGAAVKDSLVRIGHDVDWIVDHRSLDCDESYQPYDCILIDPDLLSVPCGALIEQIRENRLAGSMIVLGPAHNPRHSISVLDQGADDCVAKPVDLRELAARIRSVTRRHRHYEVVDTVLTHGPLRLLPQTRTATWFDAPVDLSGKEFSLLEMFLHAKSRVLAREDVHARLYGRNTEVEGNLVEVHIHHVRRKTCKKLIRTVRGVGYELATESELTGADLAPPVRTGC